ncbi:UdgX family uracil-DNA binding protein [Ramlibacter sp. G-1-2-2]|uniref:Type-4 uracil-DNA glycosylase n=1 Tax=Ramlibacter agri TaxID=2728837 RepID=A0A848H2C6_9BURK|nr:UdgX family uracil-DNA binding protein [Ramlibacter agri]NML44975.1 UdgX family uracil-DNA binding protein [Ramlibacter agri]
MRVQLASETDLDGFRREARALLASRARPAQVEWSVEGGQEDLFAADETVMEPQGPAPALRVPPAFVELCQHVLLHREPQRFALLYRLLWRLAHEPNLRHDPLDPDMLQAREFAQAVRRDIHKMHAFVRFRPVGDAGDGAQPLHVAWYEPAHRIVEAVAPWFQRRFANMRWAILTPDACVEWDGSVLQLRPGASRAEAPPPDAGEQLWLTYYRNIFNPARLKLATMQKEMPRRYWPNLPEAQLIAPLAAEARERSTRMIEQPASTPLRRIPIAPAATTMLPPEGLPRLNAAMQQCRTCPIGALATQAVAGEGPLAPRLMFVGEQPGDQEDLRGRPFVGPAGQLLERAFAEAGIVREEVYLTNAVRHFKYDLRGKHRIHKTPSQQEALACLHWLREEIALVRPRALVALGATAARSLLGRSVVVRAERGTWLARGDGLQVLVTLHPSALLRLPVSQQARAFEEFVTDLRRAAA